MRQRGFVSWLILVIIALALLKYFFNWSIFDAVASEQGRSTISYIRDIFNLIWSYLARPFNFIWQEVVWPAFRLIWQQWPTWLEWGRAKTN